MKHLYLLISIILISEPAWATSDVSYSGVTSLSDKKVGKGSFSGPTTLDRITADSLSVSGPLQFDDLKVTGETSVSGPTKGFNGTFKSLSLSGEFKAQNIQVDQLTITGPVDVINLKVTGLTDITGPLKALHSEFHDVVLASNDIQLEDVQTQKITVKNTRSESQIMVLKGMVKIKGDIVFESGKGLIKKGYDAVVFGKIEGAKVEELKQ